MSGVVAKLDPASMAACPNFTLSRALALCAVVIVVALPVLVTPAQATDSHAPKGARPDWLPNSEWVMSSWLPYDERRLQRLLHVTREDLYHWLDDSRSIWDLARRRGWRTRRGLAAALLAPRRHAASRALMLRLRRRTLDTITQPHLSRHVLFHVFHTPAIPDSARALLDMTPKQFRALRSSGASPLAMAKVTGRSPDALAGALDALLVVRARRAIATGSSTRQQAGRLLQIQRDSMQQFLAHTYRTPAEQFTFACSLHVF